MDNQTKALSEKLATLEVEFSRRVGALEKRIDYLEGKRAWSKDAELNEQTNAIERIENQKQNQSAKEPVSTLNANALNIEHVQASLVVAESPMPPVQDKTKETTNSSNLETSSLAAEVGKQGLFAILAPLLAPLFGPVASLTSSLSRLYRHYQQQGKAPVFFMTATGILALVLGFAYLLQYSFNEYFGPTGKVLLGFVTSIAVTAGGVRLSKTNKEMSEYGSSIIALGLILSFLCAYFAGPYYELLPAVAGFFLLAAVTAVACILALLFETRVVAVVALLGGATMPIVMGHVDQAPALYLCYLLLLSVSMLYLSQRIQWPQLAYICMGLGAAMIEFSISNKAQTFTESYGLIAVIHGFFYAFSYYALQGLNRRLVINKARLIILSSNVIFYLFICQQLILSSEFMATLLLFNVLPWIALFLFQSKLFGYSPNSEEYRAVQAIALLHAGLLAGVGILILSSPELIGLIWCIEALMLIYLGCRFQFVAVRIEGYITLVVSIGAMASQVVFWVGRSIEPSVNLLALNMDIGWANLLALTVLIYSTVVLLKREQNELTEKESTLILIAENFMSVCLSVSFLLTIGIFSAQAMWLFAIVPMFYLIKRSESKGLALTELFGLGHFTLLLVPMAISAHEVGNFHFSEQSTFGQIARVEIFLSLWGLAEFYKRYYPESSLFGFTECLRKLFYCLIPVLFLPKVLRQYGDYFPLALWGSSGIALFLYSRLKFVLLKIELYVLVACATVTTLVACVLSNFNFWHGNAVAALLAGLVLFIVIGWLGQALRSVPIGSPDKRLLNKVLKPLSTVAVYYFGLAIFIVLYPLTGNVELSLLAMMIYFTGFSLYQPIMPPARSNLVALHIVIFLLFSMITISHVLLVWPIQLGRSHNLWLALINGIAALCSYFFVYRCTSQNKIVWKKTGGRLLNTWIFNLLTIGVYVALLSQLFDDMLGPAISFLLVVHATIILFQTINPKLKKLIWLSAVLYSSAALKVLIWDMHDFSLIQKIIVFMLIGICMLGAAFKFQKIVAKNHQPAF
ncbi:DUF2339 domain-containing protein [Agarivorans sp. DSG3-1]|uniref:DUF2339 domain-containing protein n=1 Tax=Agarivorans sp. DSG3-1 TaxID=3342249 RepID=UPI00398F8E0E